MWLADFMGSYINIFILELAKEITEKADIMLLNSDQFFTFSSFP